MANIIFGNDGSLGNYSVSGSTGWNISDKKIWGNTAADTFSFANVTWAKEFYGNSTWSLYGGGGEDTITFDGVADSGNLVAFNLSQLQSSSSTNKFTVIGSAQNDEFIWAGTAFPYFTKIDGGSAGTDTFNFSAASTGKTVNLYDSTYANIDIVIGSAYADTIRGVGTTNETLIGAGGADVLWGGDGSSSDSLKGGAGADTFWFGMNQGNDTIFGDFGNDAKSDVVKLSGINFADLTFGYDAGANGVVGFKTDTGYEGHLYLGNFADAATDYANRVNTFVADNLTFGLTIANNAGVAIGSSALADVLYGGTGKDTLTAGAGDSLYGGDNDDLLKYVSTGTYFDGGANGAAGDTLSGNWSTTAVDISLSDSKFKGIEILEGSSLADVLRGTTAAETLSGGKNGDQLWGGLGADYNDKLIGGAGADTFWFYANQGNDVIGAETTATDSASDVVKLSGINFADLTFSASTNDMLINFTDATGYTGQLTVENAVKYAGVTANRVNTFVTDDMTFGLAVGNDTGWALSGTTLIDILQGGAGNDTLTAGAGDKLFGGAGNDSLKYIATGGLFDGGNDTDILTGEALATAMDINLYDANVKNIEVLIGSSLGDVLRGSTLANTLQGGIGADKLWGNQGNDIMTGGLGADTYWFGLLDGVDTISDDTAYNAKDVVVFSDLSFGQLSFGISSGLSELEITVGADSTNKLVLEKWATNINSDAKRVNTFVTTDLTFGLEMATTATALSTDGTSLSDYMVGESGADVLGGSAGADTIFAMGGGDSVKYKATAAKVDGGEGQDSLTAASAAAGVDIDLRNVDATKTNFANIEVVTGSSYDDILRGTTGAETLVGGSGNDAIWGAAGADSLEGGVGSDTYWFGGADGNDTIKSATNNSSDYVVFSSIDGRQIGGADLKTVELSGNDLVITLSTDDALTLADWNLGSGNKLNKFNFGANGNYSLAITAGVATWTKLS